MTEGIHAKYVEMIKKEPDIYKQDQLRKDEGDEVQKVKDSYVKFDGIGPGAKEWGTSIIQTEFAARNDESMMTLWEKDQASLPLLLARQALQAVHRLQLRAPGLRRQVVRRLRQAHPEPLRRRGDEVLADEDQAGHEARPPRVAGVGDFQLYAIDQSEFYGNFCLVLFNPTVAKQVDAARTEHNTKPAHGNALIDAVTQQPKTTGDSNENIVDQITGKTPK